MTALASHSRSAIVVPMERDLVQRFADAIAEQWPASSVERAEEILRELVNRRHAKTPPVQTHVRVVTWRTILHLVCTFYNVTERQLIGRRRTKQLSRARFALYTALHEFLDLSPNDVAEIVHRDHTTILYGIARLNREADQWQRLSTELALLRVDGVGEAAE